MLMDKLIDHNYNNQKVAMWVSENFSGTTEQSTGFGCSCGGDGWDETERIDSEYIIERIPELTEEEKQELVELEQVWIYYCPECKEWAMDGLNT